MRRVDKKKLPIGLIPNGSGNDTCTGFLIDKLSEALNYIKKGDLVKVDLLRVMIDFPSEQDIIGDVNNHMRYSIINSSLCLTANCAKNAGKWKSVFG
jgi:diacylglycerol kinase family enzyme